jgi:MinD superfamily P-loop ATPase
MVHARLHIAEENSGKLVSLVRHEARKLGENQQKDLILTDGPPGVGCPVIASISGADAVLIVTEPTVSGKHDMERVTKLADHFKVPAMICVNKFDLNPEMTDAIERYARKRGLHSVGRIPFDPVFIKAMVLAQTVFEYNVESGTSGAIHGIWQVVKDRLNV